MKRKITLVQDLKKIIKKATDAMPAPQKGETGEQGDTGSAGPMGPQGPKGAAGAAGQAGPSGQQGATGAQGPKGDAGLQGPAGPKGDQGLQGLKGDTGATGVAGPKGDKGDVGNTGPAGAQGVKGDTGAQGAAGVGFKRIVQISNEDPVAVTSEAVIFSQAISANELAANGELVLEITGKLKTLLAVANITFKISYGGQSLTIANALPINLSTDAPWNLKIRISRKTTAKQQSVYAKLTSSNLFAKVEYDALADFTVDETVNNNLVVTALMAGITVNTVFTPKLSRLEIR